MLGTALHAEAQIRRKTLPVEFTSLWGEQRQTRGPVVAGRRGCALQWVRSRLPGAQRDVFEEDESEPNVER